MLSPDETAVETVLGHPFLVRSRRFVAQGCMRFKSTLNATRSAGGSGFLCGFLALLARVRANSFQMKRVFVGGIIMGRAPKDMKHPELRGNDTVLRDALLVKTNCSQNRCNATRFSQKKRTTRVFFASMRNIANPHQQAVPGFRPFPPLAPAIRARRTEWPPTKNFPTFSKASNVVRSSRLHLPSGGTNRHSISCRTR